MSFSISLITSTGYPFYFKKITEEPAETNLHMRFYNFVHPSISNNQKPEQTFELQAGLVSALYEFARCLDQPIELLRFNTIQSVIADNSPISLASSNVPVNIAPNSDVLITPRTEVFLIPKHYEMKINLIYNNVIKKHIPLGPEKRITDADESLIVRILTDQDARLRLSKHQNELNEMCQKILQDYSSYGVQGLAICSFDGNPLQTFGFTIDEVLPILRELGSIPIAKEFQWLFRTSRFSGQERSLIIINSGCGPTVGSVMMPLYYILICSEQAFLGDSPTTIINMLNSLLCD